MKTFLRMALPLALLIAAPLHAQTTIGVKGGVNIASVDTNVPDISDLAESKTGFVGGGFATFGLGSLFALQPELLYSQKGFKAEESGQSAELGLNYFEIPVLAVVKLSTTLSPHLYAGPVLSIESKCKVTFEGETETCEEAREGAPRTKGADSGLMFGGGIAFQFGPGSLLLDAMYYHGLTDISENSDEIDSIKTRTFYLSAGYMFPIGS